MNGRLESTSFLLVLALVVPMAACEPDTSCEVLFGRPSEQTGLDETQCRPSCGCGGEAFVPRDWDAASLESIRGYGLSAPLSELSEDPYAGAAPAPAPAGEVCAVVVDDLASRAYRLETFASAPEAEAAGAHVTHDGACGLCSTLADLAVYAGTVDLTTPVRQCGIDTFVDGHEANVACLEALGFTRPCAQIWAYNTAHTRAECGAVCIRLLSAPYHTADGELNACLACDEEESGPVFKAIAGRTRRNSGLASALCRPCDEVPRISHAYP